MGPKCKKIKYTKGRTKRPVIKAQKPASTTTCPKSIPTIPTVSSLSDIKNIIYDYGEYEKEVQSIDFPQKSPLEYLRSWVGKQRYIPQDLSDEFLLLYLSGAANDLETAVNKLQKYFESRQEPSYLFRNRDPLNPHIREIFDTLYVLPMPEATENGTKVIITGLMKPTIAYCQMEHLKALGMVFDLLIWEKDFGFGDFVIVLDGRCFKCFQLLENQLCNHKSFTNVILDTIPGTLRSFYLLYPPPQVTNIAENRNGIWITVVNSKEEMCNFLPRECLPFEFGGDSGNLGDLLEQWRIHMKQCRKFFINFENRMANDYKRKIFHEQEAKERGKNWVQNMKLVADEWEYKIKYYEMMKNFVPLRYPGFGSLRNMKKFEIKTTKDPLKKCRQKAKEEEEEEAAKIWQVSYRNKSNDEEIKKAKLEEEMEKLKRCFENSICFCIENVAEDKNCY